MSIVDQLVRAMPEKESRIVYADRARALEDQLNGERVVTLARCGFPFGTVVVTDQRLIVLLQDGGGVQTIPYRDISGLHVIAGSKGLLGLGARRSATLVVRYRNGRPEDTMSIGHDGDWGFGVAEAIVDQHATFSLRRA
jgi:hypothetical protein